MTASPESMGMSSSRLARIDRFLNERYVSPAKLPFALLHVVCGGTSRSWARRR